MNLFEIDPETNMVKLNKPWIYLTPEFKVLLTRDKGSPGDFRGEKKYQAIKEFTLIYFFVDFHSSIRDWEDDHRWKEALKYADLDNAKVRGDKELQAAIAKYQELQLEAAPAIRSHKSIYKAIRAMDNYFNDLDFTEVDKKGEMLHSPQAVANSIVKMGDLYDAADSFKARIEKQLSEDQGIRGTAELGDNEGKIKPWNDRLIAEKSEEMKSQPAQSFSTLQDMVKAASAAAVVPPQEVPPATELVEIE